MRYRDVNKTSTNLTSAIQEIFALFFILSTTETAVFSNNHSDVFIYKTYYFHLYFEDLWPINQHRKTILRNNTLIIHMQNHILENLISETSNVIYLFQDIVYILVICVCVCVCVCVYIYIYVCIFVRMYIKCPGP